MAKIDRNEVYKKYDGRCAYCGAELPQKGWHVDHIIPQMRYSERHECLIVDCKKFIDYDVNNIANLNPACRRCNLRKSSFSLEEFRGEIEEQKNRLRKYNAGFRLAEDFGQIFCAGDNDRVEFYFEIIKRKQVDLARRAGKI